MQEENLASHEIPENKILSCSHSIIFLRNKVPERLNSGSMHRQVLKQNCFQLPPALIVVFIVAGHEWQQRENGEPMNFFTSFSLNKIMQLLLISLERAQIYGLSSFCLLSWLHQRTDYYFYSCTNFTPQKLLLSQVAISMATHIPFLRNLITCSEYVISLGKVHTLLNRGKNLHYFSPQDLMTFVKKLRKRQQEKISNVHPEYTL